MFDVLYQTWQDSLMPGVGEVESEHNAFSWLTPANGLSSPDPYIIVGKPIVTKETHPKLEMAISEITFQLLCFWLSIVTDSYKHSEFKMHILVWLNIPTSYSGSNCSWTYHAVQHWKQTIWIYYVTLELFAVCNFILYSTIEILQNVLQLFLSTHFVL